MEILETKTTDPGALPASAPLYCQSKEISGSVAGTACVSEHGPRDLFPRKLRCRSDQSACRGGAGVILIPNGKWKF